MREALVERQSVELDLGRETVACRHLLLASEAAENGQLVMAGKLVEEQHERALGPHPFCPARVAVVGEDRKLHRRQP